MTWRNESCESPGKGGEGSFVGYGRTGKGKDG